MRCNLRVMYQLDMIDRSCDVIVISPESARRDASSGEEEVEEPPVKIMSYSGSAKELTNPFVAAASRAVCPYEI